ncbi:MAG: solute carrier family 13 (sodium-dependent dicarboxylate transporter), er 2/3/5 [Thermoleophilaceae bacterium]|jgi:sodium-dependent dicarboxylate transporter 2/3/5|nr:solute carrier family 13 (sodium-dependent dicarboxylate transporter), er 2/3/5 [Thermoleophilaceae bacterium]
MGIDTEKRAPGGAHDGPPEDTLSGGGTYKTLDEQEGRLSTAEQRFERQRRTVGLFLGPIVFAAMMLIPFDLDGNQHRLAAILAFVVVWWVTEAIPIPMTALLGVALCALLEATPPPPEGDSSVDVVFSLFTDDTVMLFIGSFIIAQSMVVHGLHRRLAYRVLSLSWVGGNTFRIILAFGLIGAITSPVMSNTAGAAMMLPIALGVMAVVGGMVAQQADGEHRVERLRFGAALMLVITYSITVGGLLLPIGSPPNLIGRELLEAETGEPITFFEWFVMALPIALVMFVAVVLIVTLFNRPEVKEVEGVEEYVHEERRKLGSLGRGEKNTLLVLAFALIGWFLPGLVGIVAGDDSDAYVQVSEAANEGIVAIVAASLLFVLPIDWARRKFTLNWNQAKEIDWGTVILFGGGLVLGSLLSQTGLAKVVGESLSDSLGVTDLVGITIVVVIVSVLVSETTSNTASAAIMVPIAISIAAASDVNPTIPGLAAIFGANYGFMLPVSTPPNAIVYSSGMLPITRMIKAGAVFDIIGAVLCVVGVIAMANLVGLA